MTTRFIPPLYPAGRILLLSGEIPVGAIFPPAGEPGTTGQKRSWTWRLWQCANAIPIEGGAKTEVAAREAILAAWRNTLARMDLREIGTEDGRDG